MKIALFIIAVVLALPTFACDMEVVKVSVPINTTKTSLCVDEYFQLRNLAQFSISDETYAIFRDHYNMQFDDMLLFNLPSSQPLGEVGRTQLLSKVWSEYTQSLRDVLGTCQLHIYSGSTEMKFEDFPLVERNEEGQPGNRRILQSENVSQPRWELVCKNALQQDEVIKKGNYFFIFVDVIENIGTVPSLKSHLAKYLLSFR